MLHEYSFMSKKAIGQHKFSCMQSKYKTGRLMTSPGLLKAELETPPLILTYETQRQFLPLISNV